MPGFLPERDAACLLPPSEGSRCRRMKAKLPALILITGVCVSSRAEVFTKMVSTRDGTGYDKNLLLGALAGRSNMRINIVRIGIGGDADANSGKQVFQAIGGGLDFVWAAGQDVNPPFDMDYVLAPTTLTQGYGRSLSLLSITGQQLAMPGQSVDVVWRGTADWDGWYTYDTDPFGTILDDQRYRGSARAWMQYQYLPVPEPAALACLAVGLVTLRRRAKRTTGKA